MLLYSEYINVIYALGLVYEQIDVWIGVAP